ncbi:MAG: hypothetical protein HDS37_01035 [Bacteroides sp.]|nr:hypothetical protein [Bacteroides sp.]
MNFDRMELILVIFHVHVKDLATVDARGIVVSISCLLLPEGVPGRKISHHGLAGLRVTKSGAIEKQKDKGAGCAWYNEVFFLDKDEKIFGYYEK